MCFFGRIFDNAWSWSVRASPAQPGAAAGQPGQPLQAVPIEDPDWSSVNIKLRKLARSKAVRTSSRSFSLVVTRAITLSGGLGYKAAVTKTSLLQAFQRLAGIASAWPSCHSPAHGAMPGCLRRPLPFVSPGGVRTCRRSSANGFHRCRFHSRRWGWSAMPMVAC